MSLPIVYFENNLLTVSSHPVGYAHLTYRPGPRAPGELLVALEQAGDLLQRRRWFRLLEDQRHLPAPTAAEQQQLSAYWQRQTRTLGYPLCIATVLAHDVFARLAAATLRHELRGTISYRLFGDMAAASSWLQQQVVCPPGK